MIGTAIGARHNSVSKRRGRTIHASTKPNSPTGDHTPWSGANSYAIDELPLLRPREQGSAEPMAQCASRRLRLEPRSIETRMPAVSWSNVADFARPQTASRCHNLECPQAPC
jgi:hypothetical protein